MCEPEKNAYVTYGQTRQIIRVGALGEIEGNLAALGHLRQLVLDRGEAARVAQAILLDVIQILRGQADAGDVLRGIARAAHKLAVAVDEANPRRTAGRVHRAAALKVNVFLRERPFEVLRLAVVAEHADIGDVFNAVPAAVHRDVDRVSAGIIHVVIQIALHNVIADGDHFSSHCRVPPFRSLSP